MRFRQIEVFHAIYTSGSISAAAMVLHVSPSSVSKVLQHTQLKLGLQLFRLVRQRLVPTEEAHALFVEVSEVFGRLRSLQKSVKRLSSTAGKHIKLAVVPSLGLYVAPLAIARFRRLHPEITFEVQTLHYDELFEGLYERRCDIAIAYDPPKHPRMARCDLATAELMLLFQRSAMPDVGDSVSLRMLDGQDVVGLTTGGPVGELLRSEFERQKIDVHEVVTNGTFYIAAALARCGAGMAIVDEFTARATASGDMDAKPFSPALKFNLQYVYLEDRPPSEEISQFLLVFAKILSEVPDHV